MSTVIQHNTTPIACPDWCQSKPHDTDGGFDGPHTWPAVQAMAGFNDDEDDNYNSSALVSVDLPEPGTGDEGAVVYLTAGNLTLSPKQARSVALALLTVASWTDDQATQDARALNQPGAVEELFDAGREYQRRLDVKAATA